MTRVLGKQIGRSAIAVFAGAALTTGCAFEEDAGIERPAGGSSTDASESEDGAEDSNESGGESHGKGSIEWEGKEVDTRVCKKDCDLLEPGQMHWELRDPGLIKKPKLTIRNEEKFEPQSSWADDLFFSVEFPYDDIRNIEAEVTYKGEASKKAKLVLLAHCPLDPDKDHDDDKDKTDPDVVFEGKKAIEGLELEKGKKGKKGHKSLRGWRMSLYEIEKKKSLTLVDSTETDKRGRWNLKLSDVEIDKDDWKSKKWPDYAVCEEKRKGWRQAYPAVGDKGTRKVDGRACHLVNLAREKKHDHYGDGPLVVSELDFVNVALGKLGGVKYFDGLQEGIRSEQTPGIEGWPIQILQDDEILCTVVTDEDGRWSSVDIDVKTGEPCPELTAGTYQVREVRALNSKIWKQTGNVELQGDADIFGVTLEKFVYTVELPVTKAKKIQDLHFGNVCFLKDTIKPEDSDGDAVELIDKERNVPFDYTKCQAPIFKDGPV